MGLTHPLAFPSHNAYAVDVSDKELNRRGNLKYTKAHEPRNAVFLRVFAIACLLWTVMAGAFGLLVCFCVPVSNLLVTVHPSWKEGGGLTAHKGGSHATQTHV